MENRKIIADAWAFTQSNKKLIIWFGFFPALFTTAVGMGLISYQYVAFRESRFFGNDDSIFKEIINFAIDLVKNNPGIILPMIIIAAIFAFFSLLYPTFARASAIQVIARKKNGQNPTLADGIKYGLGAFLPLLEYSLLIKTFSFFTVVVEMSTVIRNFGPDPFMFFLPIFILIALAGIVLTLLFTYADFFIVVDREKVFDSMRLSTKLVVNNLKQTFLVTILMMLIGVRVVIQAVMVFLLPAVVLLVSGYVATLTSIVPALIVGAALVLIFWILTAYLTGIVEIFSFSVWTFTFLELTEKADISAREKAEPLSEEVQPNEIDGKDNQESS